MTKSTLLKRTKNELADMLMSLKDNYDNLDNDYHDVCDKYATCIAENDKYVEDITNTLDKQRIISIIFFVISIVSVCLNIGLILS